jgi:hypothetical protein
MSDDPAARSTPKDDADNPRTLADSHLDIGLGNQFRLEYIKHLVSLSTGVFVFSIAFMKDIMGKPIAQVLVKPVLICGWASLVVSTFAGILHMRYWASYYISWGTGWQEPGARRYRSTLNRRRKAAEVIQIAGFVIGLILFVVFTAFNIA